MEVDTMKNKKTKLLLVPIVTILFLTSFSFLASEEWHCSDFGHDVCHNFSSDGCDGLAFEDCIITCFEGDDIDCEKVIY
jgi:hypothetical protein